MARNRYTYTVLPAGCLPGNDHTGLASTLSAGRRPAIQSRDLVSARPSTQDSPSRKPLGVPQRLNKAPKLIGLASRLQGLGRAARLSPSCLTSATNNRCRMSLHEPIACPVPTSIPARDFSYWAGFLLHQPAAPAASLGFAAVLAATVKPFTSSSGCSTSDATAGQCLVARWAAQLAVVTHGQPGSVPPAAILAEAQPQPVTADGSQEVWQARAASESSAALQQAAALQVQPVTAQPEQQAPQEPGPTSVEQPDASCGITLQGKPLATMSASAQSLCSDSGLSQCAADDYPSMDQQQGSAELLAGKKDTCSPFEPQEVTRHVEAQLPPSIPHPSGAGMVRGYYRFNRGFKVKMYMQGKPVFGGFYHDERQAHAAAVKLYQELQQQHGAEHQSAPPPKLNLPRPQPTQEGAAPALAIRKRQVHKYAYLPRIPSAAGRKAATRGYSLHGSATSRVYVVGICSQGKLVYGGQYKLEKDAAEAAWKMHHDVHGLPANPPPPLVPTDSCTAAPSGGKHCLQLHRPGRRTGPKSTKSAFNFAPRLPCAFGGHMYGYGGTGGSTKPWVVNIYHQGRAHRGGCFATEREAADAAWQLYSTARGKTPCRPPPLVSCSASDGAHAMAVPKSMRGKQGAAAATDASQQASLPCNRRCKMEPGDMGPGSACSPAMQSDADLQANIPMSKKRKGLAVNEKIQSRGVKMIPPKRQHLLPASQDPFRNVDEQQWSDAALAAASQRLESRQSLRQPYLHNAVGLQELGPGFDAKKISQAIASFAMIPAATKADYVESMAAANLSGKGIITEQAIAGWTLLGEVCGKVRTEQELQDDARKETYRNVWPLQQTDGRSGWQCQLALDARGCGNLLSQLPHTKDPAQANTVLMEAEVPAAHPLPARPLLMALSFKAMPPAAPLLVLDIAPSCTRLESTPESCLQADIPPQHAKEKVQVQHGAQPAAPQAGIKAQSPEPEEVPMADVTMQPVLMARHSMGSSSGTHHHSAAACMQNQQAATEKQPPSLEKLREAWHASMEELSEHMECTELCVQLLQVKLKSAHGKIAREKQMLDELQEVEPARGILDQCRERAEKFSRVAQGLRHLLDDLH